MPSVFISYSSADKDFVESLAAALSEARIPFWLDDRELKVGDSLVGKISEAIANNDFFIVIVSRAAVRSEWVNKELSWAMMKELSDKKVVVLPVLIEDCAMPPMLTDKVYADFRRSYDEGLNKLFQSLGVTGRPAHLAPLFEVNVALMQRPVRAKALVVDDNQQWQRILKRILEETGLSVAVASSHEEAVNLLRRQFFHLLILELRLNPFDPDDRSGLRIMEILHQELNEGTQAVCVSGYGTLEDGAAAAKLGAYHVQEKMHFSTKSFQDTVKEAVALALDAFRRSERRLHEVARDWEPETEYLWVDKFLRFTKLSYAQADNFIWHLLRDFQPLLPLMHSDGLPDLSRATPGIQTIYYWSKMLSMPIRFDIGEPSSIRDHADRERLIPLKTIAESRVIGLVSPAFGFDFQNFRERAR